MFVPRENLNSKFFSLSPFLYTHIDRFVPFTRSEQNVVVSLSFTEYPFFPVLRKKVIAERISYER